MNKTLSSRFARFGADGEIEALVADGLPEWPADDDLSSLTDEQIGELHESYMSEVNDLATAEPDSIDPERAEELATRVEALRTEAESRLSAEPAAAADQAGDGQETGGEGTDAGETPDVLARLRALQVPAEDDDEATLLSVSPISAEQIGAAVAAAVEGVVAPLATALAERVPAEPRRPLSARDLGAYRPDDLAPNDGAGESRRPRGQLVHTGDVPGLPTGHRFSNMDELVNAFMKRYRDLGKGTQEDEKAIIASFQSDSDVPTRRDLRGINEGRAMLQKVRAVCGPEAMGVDPWNLERELPIGKGGMIVEDPENLVASGGLAAPVEPYYPQMVLAEADRPVLEALPTFIAERGGIKLTLPPTIGTLTSQSIVGSFTDGVTNTDTSFVSATAAFVAADVGQPIIETDAKGVIPSGTTILSVTNGTTVVLSQATTGTTTAVAFRLPARNPNNLGPAVGLVTAAQDAAGPPNTVKFTFDAPIGSQREYDVYSIYTSLQFANLTARTFPEQVEAYIRLANAVAARVAETQLLDQITNYSTLFTGAKTFGTARQLLAQIEHQAAYYRNHNRMDPAAVLRVLLPAWALNAMRGDYIASFIGGKSEWGLSDAELAQWLADRRILVSWYWDGPSDVSQLFASPGSGAINTGTNTATPIAIPDYPGSGNTTAFRTKVVSYMWAEGTWLALTTGELNLGLVRDSILNSQNRFRNFEEIWEAPAMVGPESLRCVHTVASDGSYASAVSVTLGAGSGL